MSHDVPCRVLAWDTDFFGVRIGRVEGNRLTEPLVERVEQWARSEGIVCLYFLADLSDAATTRIAESRRFHLTDIRVTLDQSLPASRLGSGARAARIRVAADDDTESLKAIARVSHTDSRFFFDGRFGVEKCAALYETWIEKSVNGFADCVFTAEVSGRAVGYVTCHIDGPDRGRIGLVGLAAEARGLGLGSGLVETALDWFGERKVREVSVVTQARNVAGQRLYQRCGFRTARTEAWYHWWFDAADASG